MDVAAALLAIRVLTDAIHNNINIIWNVSFQNGTSVIQRNIFPQVIAWFFALGFTLVYNLSPLPQIQSTNPLITYVEELLNTLVIWVAAMGTDDLLKKLKGQ